MRFLLTRVLQAFVFQTTIQLGLGSSSLCVRFNHFTGTEPEDYNCTKSDCTDFMLTFTAANGCIKHTGEQTWVLVFLRALQKKKKKHFPIIPCTQQTVSTGGVLAQRSHCDLCCWLQQGQIWPLGDSVWMRQEERVVRTWISSISCKWTNN